MGQYYKAVNIDKEQFVSSHEYSNGAKLMEHSYIGNNYVGAIENMLIPGGNWYRNHIVWAGDYADEGNFVPEKYGKKENLYSVACGDFLEVKPEDTTLPSEYKYIVNYTKQQFVDRTKTPVGYCDLKVNPLPLLVSDGNGKGGGDYHCRNDYDSLYIGFWTGDEIGIEKEKPEGFEEIITLFKEE